MYIRPICLKNKQKIAYIILINVNAVFNTAQTQSDFRVRGLPSNKYRRFRAEYSLGLISLHTLRSLILNKCEQCSCSCFGPEPSFMIIWTSLRLLQSLSHFKTCRKASISSSGSQNHLPSVTLYSVEKRSCFCGPVIAKRDPAWLGLAEQVQLHLKQWTKR